MVHWWIAELLEFFSLSDINCHGNLKYISLLIYVKNLEKMLTIQYNRCINI